MPFDRVYDLQDNARTALYSQMDAAGAGLVGHTKGAAIVIQKPDPKSIPPWTGWQDSLRRRASHRTKPLRRI